MDLSENTVALLKNIFSVIGVCTVTYCLLKIAKSIFTGINHYILTSEINFKGYGEWAIVTGATDGIGKEYAIALAKRGLSIVLISRSPEKLAEVAREVAAVSNSVKVKTIAANFTGGLEIYAEIKKGLTGLDIGVLVNNVGISYPYPEFFGELSSEQFVMDLINVNITSTTMMTYMVLPKMAEKRKGIIINLSSASGQGPLPLLNEYAAAKGYVDFFSRGLQLEYKKKGIIIQSVLPYFVSTKMSRLRRSLWVPNAQDYVRQALATVGKTDRTFGYITHELQAYVYGCLPRLLFVKVVMSTFLAARQKALKKQMQKNQ